MCGRAACAQRLKPAGSFPSRETPMKRIVCLGGGPAGLYSAILLRKALPAARIEVYERNRPDDTFGWGVVFSDQTMGNFRTADPETHRAVGRFLRAAVCLLIQFARVKVECRAYAWRGVA